MARGDIGRFMQFFCLESFMGRMNVPERNQRFKQSSEVTTASYGYIVRLHF